MSDLSSRKYLRWDSPGVEEIPSNETETIQAIVGKVNETQRRFYEDNGHCYGGTHARTQGVVKGTLIVPDELAPHLKQTELFSKGHEYAVIARYSSEPSDPKLDDRIAQPRGLALKIFNVQGEMFHAGETFPTQDVEFNSTPALDLANAKTTDEIFDLRLKHGYATEEMHKHVRPRDDADLQMERHKVPNNHLEAITFYSQTAYRFGDYVMKYRLLPASQEQRRRSKETVEKERDGVLHEWLSDFYHHYDAEYEFQVQLLENLEEQSVEYGGAVWDEEKYPFQTVARLIFPKQDSWNEERNQFWVNHLRLDPWHGLLQLQPLGSANRVRRIVYPASSSYRRMLNEKEEINVLSASQIPGY